MDRLYNVTIEYFGIKKQDKFPKSTICLGKDGAFLVMDAQGETVRFVANNCKVEQIAAHVIILRGYTDKPRYITAYCVYANDNAYRTPGGQNNQGCMTPCTCSDSLRAHWTHEPTGMCDSPQDIPCYFHDVGKCRASHKCSARNRNPNRDIHGNQEAQT